MTCLERFKPISPQSGPILNNQKLNATQATSRSMPETLTCNEGRSILVLLARDEIGGRDLKESCPFNSDFPKGVMAGRLSYSAKTWLDSSPANFPRQELSLIFPSESEGGTP